VESPESANGEDDPLRRRVAELELELADSERKFNLLTKVTNDAISILDKGIIIDASREFVKLMGYTMEETLGRSAMEFAAPESRDLVVHNIRSGNEEPYEVTMIRKDGSRILVQVRGLSLEYRGRTVRVAALQDITSRRKDEDARRAAAVQEEVIRAQASMLAQLSTPLLPLSSRVLLLPVIGEVNAARAAQVVETLTRGVFAHRATTAILDITGTPAVGAEVADMLLRAARAARLLGAQVILTGVRPEVAQALVQLGADLSGLITLGSLQQGVAYALTRA
jgi:rsbT co-antagonist protein RsbR